jgi:hypothetical protein
MGAVTATDAERDAVDEVEPAGGEHAVTPLELFSGAPPLRGLRRLPPE